MMRFLTILLVAATAWCQVAKEANRDYETQEDRAKMVGRLESPARLAILQPAELVERLGVVRGSTVVDLGTGTGNLLKDLSQEVGSDGHVIAEDIFPDFLERARDRARTAKLVNVQFVLGTETDPKLPDGAADLVIVLDAYHHFDYPEKMLAGIKRGLRPGGRLAIVEYHKKRGSMEVSPDFALTHIRAGAEQVVQEVEAAGYRLLWRRDHAPDRQYIAMFQIP
jgi:ubiquinone/menaquinone biosynthesis C-methylase UbiE